MRYPTRQEPRDQSCSSALAVSSWRTRRRGLRIGTSAVAVAAVVALSLGGCSSSNAGSGGSSSTNSPPADRNAQAVTAALVQLDPCALIDMNVAKSPDSPGTVTIPSGPHACILAPNAQWSPADTSILTVQVGALDDFGDRFEEKPLTLGGAKAYEIRQNTGTNALGCELDIPVSYLLAVQLQLKVDQMTFPNFSPNYDACAVVERFGAGTIAKLANPASVAFGSTKPAFADWDGCDPFSRALGQSGSSDTFAPGGPSDQLSGCEATDKQGNSLTLEANYDRWNPNPSEQVIQINGKAATLDPVNGGCVVSVNQGPSGNANIWLSAMVYQISMPNSNCTTQQSLITQVSQVVSTSSPNINTQPQRPLLYDPQDNDTGVVGACLNLVNGNAPGECTPYQGGVFVPSTFAAAAEAFANNPAVACAAFQDAVKAVYGPNLSAVSVEEGHCVFVEPTHTFELTVDLEGDQGGSPNSYSSNEVDVQNVQIAGKPALAYWSSDKSEYDIYLSPFNNLNAPGNLHLEAQQFPPRGDESTTAPTTVPLDPGTPNQLTQVMSQAVQKYFS